MSTFTGRPWKVVVNGKRSINGARHSVVLTGVVEAAPSDGITVYDVVRELVDHCEEAHAEMEITDSIQITIQPPQS